MYHDVEETCAGKKVLTAEECVRKNEETPGFGVGTRGSKRIQNLTQAHWR